MSLADAGYLAFTTYTKDGRPKPTPIWPVDAGDGRVGFVTTSKTWKVRRLPNTDHRVSLQPSDSRGRPRKGTEPREGTAEVVYGPAFQEIYAKVRERYGFRFKLVHAFLSLRFIRHGGFQHDCAVIITPDPA